MLLQVRNVFKEQSLLAKCNMVEQDHVLMNLAHVADVRYQREAEFAGEKTNRDKFRNSG